MSATAPMYIEQTQKACVLVNKMLDPEQLMLDESAFESDLQQLAEIELECRLACVRMIDRILHEFADAHSHATRSILEATDDEAGMAKLISVVRLASLFTARASKIFEVLGRA